MKRFVLITLLSIFCFTFSYSQNVGFPSYAKINTENRYLQAKIFYILPEINNEI
jgi:hypothetical protein